MKLGEVKQDGLKQDGVKQGELKQDGVKQGELKQDGVKQGELKQGELKQDGVKHDGLKQDGVKQNSEHQTSKQQNSEQQSPKQQNSKHQSPKQQSSKQQTTARQPSKAKTIRPKNRRKQTRDTPHSRNKRFCRRKDAEIQHMLDRRIWVPSLDTGRVYSREKQADLKERINASGYVVVGKGQGYLVSHIIWIAAHGLPRTGYEIDHKNGNKRDNRLENLQEILRAANRQKALSSLSFEEADAIRAAVASGKTQTELASRYRVSRRTIYRVLRERVVDMDARTKARPATGAYPEQVREEIRRIGVDAVLSIIDEYDAGLSYWHIAKNWRVTIGTVKAIIAREMEARSDYTALCDDWYETTDNAALCGEGCADAEDAAPCGEGCADAEDAATCGEGCADAENIVLCSNGGDSNEKAD